MCDGAAGLMEPANCREDWTWEREHGDTSEMVAVAVEVGEAGSIGMSLCIEPSGFTDELDVGARGKGEITVTPREVCTRGEG